MITIWNPLVYTHRIKNWEREKAKILSMVLETKNRMSKHFIQDFWFTTSKTLPLGTGCLGIQTCLLESKAHSLKTTQCPKKTITRQKDLEENKPRPITVPWVWMTTWSYKEWPTQQRKQSPQNMFSAYLLVTGRPNSQASTITLGINELKSLLAIQKNWFLKINSR